MDVHDLIIEVTRKCNMKCSFCLRGDAQKKDIDPEYVRKFIENNDIDYIGSVTFSGGEPFLRPKLINKILDIFDEESVTIGRFYVATNGTVFNNYVLDVIFRMYEMSYEEYEEYIPMVEVSYGLEYEFEDREHSVKMLSAFKFVHMKPALKYEYVISEGRGKLYNELNGTVDFARKIKPDISFITEGNMIYLNVNGQLIYDCNLSYKRQPYYSIGSVLDGLSVEELLERKNVLQFT